MRNPHPRLIVDTQRRRYRLGALAALFALVLAMLTTIGSGVTSQVARAADAVCLPGNITVNTFNGAQSVLNRYSSTGTLQASSPLVQSYGDIGFSSDGLTLYGISGSTLYTLNPNTGAETASVNISGPQPTTGVNNALSSLPDGSMLYASGGSPTIYRLNPTTGVSSLYPASLPTGYNSAGDFLSLADGDILAVTGNPNGQNALVRIHPDNTTTVVGTVPNSFGAAQSGGKIYLAGSTGNFYEVASIPTAASNATIPTKTLASTGLPFGGATSQQDSGLCSDLQVTKTADPASGTALRAGQTVNYTITLSNANGTAPAQVDQTDALAAVLDDATITTQPTVSSGTRLTVSDVSSGSFQVTGTIPAGGQTVVTYAVRVNSPDTGDHVLSNYAIPTGTATPTSCATTNTACTTHPVADITVTKTADPSAPSAYRVGQVVSYSFKATNTGATTLSNVNINETAFTGSGQMSAVSPSSVASLAAGASTTFTASYTLTQADVDRGTTSNTATATGTPPGSTPLTSTPSTVTVPANAAPALTVTKSASPSAASAYTVGQEITYSFVVNNTGNVTLSNVSVNDSGFTGSGQLGPISPSSVATLAPGGSTTFTATYTLTQADIDRGSTSNSATATGTPPGGTPVDSPPSRVTVPGNPAPALTVEKTANRQQITSAGQSVTYSFKVTNTGNVTLRGVTVDDSDFSGTGTLGAISPASVASLAPGASRTFTATYTTTQADVNAGVLTNTATASGTPPTGDPVTSGPSSVRIPASANPSLSVVKSASPSGQSSYTVGQRITYSFVVTNTGNVTMSDVAVDDSDFNGSGQLGALTPASVASLAPGASRTFTATYTLTQADVDRGSTTNSATATGTPPGSGTPVPSDPSTVTVPSTPNPSLSLVKSASPATGANVGDTVTYSFRLTNTGNVTLTDATVNEGAFSGTGDLSAVDCPVAANSLAPGASATCTATYTLTQADADAGVVTNSATSSATTPTGGTVDSPPSTATVTITAAPALTVTKTATPDSATKVGDTVTYSFRATNIGNVTVRNVTVNEGAFSGTGTLSEINCPAGARSLAPGDSVTCTATYTLTQADVDAGMVTNTATVSGDTPGGPPVTSPPSTTTVNVPADPSLTITKTSDTTTITRAGQDITYSFAVANTGNVTIDDVEVQDQDFTGTGALSAITCPSSSVAPGDTLTCTATYTVTQADVDAGNLSNTATATGNPPGGGDPVVPETPSTVIVPVTPVASIGVVKSANVTSESNFTAGKTITYSFVATNTGNVTLSNVSIEEQAFSGTGELSTIDCPAAAASVAPEAQVTCTATYTLTQEDVNAGEVTNAAVAHGTPPSTVPGGELTSTPSNAVVPTPQNASMTVVKTSDVQKISKVGQKVTYSFRVTNTGNVTITDPKITDTGFSGTGTLSAITCPAAGDSLAPGEAITCTATYAVTQADLDSGSLRNSATVTGNTPGGPPVAPSPPSTVNVPTDPQGSMTVVKTADHKTVAGVGQTIRYNFAVTNTGNITIRNAQIEDRDFTGTGKLSAITCPADISTLAPGATVDCTATYVTTAADVTAGAISNSAVVAGDPPFGGGRIPSDPSTAVVTLKPGPSGLAFTGASVETPIGIALILLLGGAALFTITRRRRRA